MKYAFLGREGGLIIISASLQNNLVSISVQDDGNGIPGFIDFERSTGFGLMLVGVIAKQIKSTIRIERENGTKIIIEFAI
jgi:two-component sensor histidine kinase